MKIIGSLLVCLMSLTSIAENSELIKLLNERSKLKNDHQLILDSVVPSKAIKNILLVESLEKISSIDEKIIEYSVAVYYKSLSQQDSISALNKRIQNIENEKDQLMMRTGNDMRMILIFKVVIAIMLLIILVLVYFLTQRKKTNEPDTSLVEINEATFDEFKSKNAALIEELKSENASLKQDIERYQLINQTMSANMNQRPTESQLRHLTMELDELKLSTEVLKNQLNSEKQKNEAILNKINKLINDLSGVTS